MKTCTCLSLALLFAVAAASCGAAEKAQKIAATIAPLLDEQAVIVAHLDYENFNADAAVKSIGRLLGQHAAIAETLTKPHTSTFRALKKAGASELYFLLSLADIPGETGAFFVPVPENAKSQGIAGIFGEFNEFQVDQIRSNVVFTGPKTLARLKEVSPVARVCLVDALVAVEETPLKIVFTPPDYFRPVIEGTLPELPEVVGGGPSTILTAGVQWAALGVDFDPQPSVRVVVQSESPEAAAAFAKKLGEACELLCKNEKARADVPEIDQIMPLLAPNVENDRVVLTLNVENGRLPQLMKALLPK